MYSVSSTHRVSLHIPKFTLPETVNDIASPSLYFRARVDVVMCQGTRYSECTSHRYDARHATVCGRPDHVHADGVWEAHDSSVYRIHHVRAARTVVRTLGRVSTQPVHHKQGNGNVPTATQETHDASIVQNMSRVRVTYVPKGAGLFCMRTLQPGANPNHAHGSV